jgi:hypothetical protein
VYSFYKNNQIDKNYWRNIRNFYKGQILSPGCELQFSNRSFVVEKVLSAGANAIFLTDTGEILRLAKLDRQRNDLKEFYEIYSDLRKNNVPVVSTEKDGYSLTQIEYLRHQFLDIRFSLGNFLQNESLFSRMEVNKITSAFIEFAKSLWPYVFIADLHGENIVFIKNYSWIAMDFGASEHSKFIDYPGKILVHFSLAAEYLPRLKALREQHADLSLREMLTLIAQEADLYQNLIRNPLSNPDQAIKDKLPLSDELKKIIGDEIALKRLQSIL